MTVSYTHPLYDNSNDWVKLVRDCIRGEPAVKAEGELYLPFPNKPQTLTPDDKERYKMYKMRAEFKNTVETTRKSLVGIPLKKEPVCELGDIEYIKANADGANKSLSSLVKDVIGEVVEVNGVGLLAEYGGVTVIDTDRFERPEELTIAEVEALGLKSSIKCYKKEDIINWRFDIHNGVYQPVLWVLKQEREEFGNDNIFTPIVVVDYIVLGLDEEGNYYQELWQGLVESGAAAVAKSADIRVYPTFNGEMIKEIPFSFVSDSDSVPDDSTSYLYPIASKAISDYQVDADFKDHLYKMKPTPYITGLDAGWLEALKEMNGGVMPEFVTGGSVAWTLPSGASVGEISASNGADAYFKYKELNKQEQLDLGARIPGAFDANTATEAALNNAESMANLADVCERVSSGITKALRWCAQFEGQTKEQADSIVYEINTDFDMAALTPQEVQILQGLNQSGKLDSVTLIEQLKNRKFIRTDKTAEEILELASNEDPTTQALAAAMGDVGNEVNN